MTRMTAADQKRFQPYTTRRSVLWERRATIGNGVTASGSVEHEREIPAGAEVVGYAFPIARGGYRIEWI